MRILKAVVNTVLLTFLGATLAARAEVCVFEWNAMGTKASLSVRSGDSEHCREMLLAAMAAIERVEAQCSLFRPDSDVRHVNNAAGDGEWIAVGEDFCKAVQLAIDAERESGHAFNPLVLPLMKKNGFYGGEINEDIAKDTLDIASISIKPGYCQLLNPAAALDLGGVAKGVGLDKAFDAISEISGEDFLLEIGGMTKSCGNWNIGLRNPLQKNPDVSLTTLPVPSGFASATSGNYERAQVTADGFTIGHIVDPRSGESVERDDLLQVTVVARSAGMADCWSTALFVLGLQAGRNQLQTSAPDIAGVIWTIVSPDGQLSLETWRNPNEQSRHALLK